MAKVKEKNWGQLSFLINNFFEIVEFKRGRGIYGDRVILRRPRRAEAIFGDADKLYEFYYMDANPVKELPLTLKLKVGNIIRLVTSPEYMNIICNFNEESNPTEWAIETQKAFSSVKLGDENLFDQLNDILEERYKSLDGKFLSKLNKHKEKQFFLAKEMGLINEDYAEVQVGF